MGESTGRADGGDGPPTEQRAKKKLKLQRDAGARTSKQTRPGEIRNYLALLRRLHECLTPRTYVEIGVASGRALVRALPETLCVGIDPAPKIRHQIPDSSRVFVQTSDDFFREHDLQTILGGPVDLAFIDGMHLFEFALRDFFHLERACRKEGVVAIHDCFPPNAEVAARERTTGFWTGDVWKLILCLREYRPELQVTVVDIAPSGLGLVTNLDPSSSVLEDRYSEICRRFADVGYADLGDSKGEKLNVIPADWDLVVSKLPCRADRSEGESSEPPPSEAPPSTRAAQKRLRRRIQSEVPLTLGPSHDSTAITLCDYPDEPLQRILGAAHELQVSLETPSIDVFENLTYFPRHHALYDEAGRRVLETCLRRGPRLREIQFEPPEAVTLPPSIRVLDRSVVYGGSLRGHWGHLLTENIARLWAVSEPDPRVAPETALLCQGSKHLTVSFVERFLHHAGIDRERFLSLDEATTLAKVIVPHPSFSIRGEAFDVHLTLPERVAETICVEEQVRTDQPVYLSRRLIEPSRKKRVVDETRLEEMLASRGVRIVSPELLGFEDQVRLFNQHSTFIGWIGSAFHSLLFSLGTRPLRTVVIGRALGAFGSYPNQFMIDCLKGVRATYIFDRGDVDDRFDSRVAARRESLVDARGIVARLKALSVI